MKTFGSFAAHLAAKELEKHEMEKVDDDVWDSLPEAERAAWILGLSEPGHLDAPDFSALPDGGGRLVRGRPAPRGARALSIGRAPPRMPPA